ncbi:thioesterase [Streptomyces eurocidicus]|uniref:Thioesterase n=1 Tax=Streptomyces eurocidicus TaxID=66423 RepID=A0A2N8NUM8_STREU|nr:thioesterase domain-containing protein [Streptomyces eurocidicus]MBB5120352.1 surfactin synthase thioesterase subunit [Streptomyces eurocidicus]MBF6055976.1 thioesterase [Streptomyces eurocidicus]PNE32473.1 thioesterase [Streptomyces eurocidicus]
MAPTPRPQRWLLRKPKGDAPTRLFCFPYSGVGASMYNRWPKRIGPAEVCLIQLPGRENRLRDPHYVTYEQLAGPLVEALLPYLDRPFAFFGHCGGALPGFATALHLMREGLPTPSALFVSSQVAPHDGPFGRFLGMTDDELAVELGELTRAMGGTPHPGLIDMSLGVLRADVDANRAYHLAEPVRLPSVVHTIGWDADREIRPDQMGGWEKYAEPGRFGSTVLQGEHYAFLGAPDHLIDVLATGMRRAQEEHDDKEGGGVDGPRTDA